MGWRDHFRAIMADPDETSRIVTEGNSAYEVGKGKTVRLAAVTAAPSREAFDAWREHPVTLFVFAALREAARAQENTWAVDSWEAGNCDAALLSELRVRADAYNSMQEGSYEAFCEWAGVTPDDEGSDH